MRYNQRQSGQILLIVILVLAVGTTVALSLIGRSTIDTSISTQVEEASRAFSAAEAGIEEALRTGLGTTDPQILTPGVTYNVTVDDIGGQTGVYQVPNKTQPGVTETIWLVNHDASGNIIETPTYIWPTLRLCWSAEAPIEPAVVMNILYKTQAGQYRMARNAYDPIANRAPDPDNNFSFVTYPAGNGCGLTNFYVRLITFADYGINAATDTLIAMRIRPVYEETQIAIDSLGNLLPLQGSHIESVGSTTDGVTRRVAVDKSYLAAPTMFDAAIYSENTFIH